MKRSLATAVFATALAAAAADEVKSTVRFSNNDRLTGSLESLTPERLVWNSPVLEKPTPFFLKGVLDLTLDANQPEITAKHEAAITLVNGDLIRGQLASVSDKFVELDTWYAGRLKFNRVNIADIRISERSQFFYRGPTGLDGWKLAGDKPAWIYQNSAFRSTAAGSIARNVDLPDECSIAFDAAWHGQLSFRLVLFSDNLASERPAAGYDVTFQPRSVYLRNCKTQQIIGHTQSAVALQENEKARIEIRASLKSGKICLFIDGHIIDVWTDPDVTRVGLGHGLHFISQNTSPVQISHIEVSAWDGEVDKLPEPQFPGGMPPFGMRGGIRFNGIPDQDEAEPAPPPEKPRPGRMELRNGDSLAGEVVSITDGMITVKTPFREVKLPVETLRSLALKPVDLERCKRENGDVRAWFPDGSSIVFRLEAVGEGTMTGYSQNFGTAVFKISAFSRIEFNIYDPELEDIRVANSW